jgi:regulator of protease activity HflC (stomatin/prohibitin superfamily)
MSHSVFLPDENSPPRVRTATLFGLARGCFAGLTVYVQFLIDVGTSQVAVLIHKTGKDIQNSDEVAPGPEYKGIQRDLLTEGRHWANPFEYTWKVVDQEVIKERELGLLISLAGEDLPYGEFLAKVDADGNPLTKGIMPGVLRPGRYPIHPYIFSLKRDEPRVIPAGFKGVVTNLAGPLPADPNKLLVPEGFRGVQEKVLDEGTYYVNKYETRINVVDCRSQRFNLADNKDIGFPSKDGFWVSLDGIIEFRVKPEQAATVYVIYNESENGDSIDEEIVRKVILPNARSFCRLQGSNELGREFIQGETRKLFQDNFEKAMRAACDKEGIEVLQALITRIRPPQKIAQPVRDREIAKQEEKQFKQQILQQVQEQKLAIEAEMVTQKQAVVQADQDVVKLVTEAKREQEVAVTKSNEKLGVSKLKLDAAKDEAQAILARGRAGAEVVRFQNQAEAAGWKQAVAAFDGDGAQYARYVLLQKMSAAYREIMVNTADSPIMQIFETFTVDKPRGKPAGPGPEATK